MKIELTITGTEQMKAALKAVNDATRPAAAAALYQEAEVIMADSKEHYVPVDLAILKASGHVQQPEISDNGTVTVKLGYGGAAKDYAVIQHERLDFRHRVGGAKYLERPLLAHANQLVLNLADRIRGLLK